MTALHVSAFAHLRAVQPTPGAVGVAAMAARLGQFATCPDREERARFVPLWSPVAYHAGTTRASRNVRAVYWLVLDYDDGTSVEAARATWARWVHIGHTTFSHMTGRPPTKAHPQGRPPAPALRVVLPLRSPVAAEVWPDVMRSILSDVGRDADPKCIDPARMFYAPVARPGGLVEHWTHTPAGGVDGPWICLAERVEAARAARVARVELAEKRRRQAQARARDTTRSISEQAAEVRRRLLESPEARERVGDALGGVRVDRQSGAIIRGVVCPACGRPSVWWVIDPASLRRARCNHANSCGWTAHLWELSAALGFSTNMGTR